MSQGNFFEDFSIGQTITHALPRTLHAGDIATYISLTAERRPLSSSAAFAQALGFRDVVMPDLLVFHTVFGKTVPDISFNAVANLGYADVRFLAPVFPGDTLRAETEIVGLRETSKGDSGIVYVKTRGLNQSDQEVLTFYRWVLVRKKGQEPTGLKEVPTLPEVVPSASLTPLAPIDSKKFAPLSWATGGTRLFGDYEVGERINHPDGMTIEESCHMNATRLYQNTAKVHFNAHQMQETRFKKRLVYGGHIISMAHAISFSGLENALFMSAWNGGTHANPSFAGDTIYAFSEVADKQETSEGLGALRLRLYAVKNQDPNQEHIIPFSEDGGRKKYAPNVVLELDYWTLMAR